ncbi:MAG: acyl-ACP--UDP-N-acetylglucosamine O-acyltransferase [Candidatus Omnitrophica bacterium]|nr:acyl-ACP--UDP-N-acetylglucosamine O-acyltransferase [Candidatus Omnitrophota bacterium]
MLVKSKIHPNAFVHPKAKLGNGVCIGPNTIVGEYVKIGADTVVGSSCVIEGMTQIGKRCKIHTGAVIGSPPQDLKYKGECTKVIIGDDNVIREYVTINLGTVDKGRTVIGNNNLLMAYSHVAHDCLIGDGVVIANAGTLAGHVTIEDKAIIGGMSAIHQFSRVGRMAIIGGCSKIIQDVPPFSMVDGHPAKVYGINSIGLKRTKIAAKSIARLKTAFKILFKMKLSTSTALKRIKKEIPKNVYVQYLVEFVKSSKRGVCKGN